MKLYSSGKWELLAGNKRLASGLTSLEPDNWHTLKIDANRDKIKAIINSEVVGIVSDSTYTYVMAGLGSSFNNVDFDNFEIESVDSNQ